MRCLHCGKDIPLLKRLSSSEFCSDAHRRQYQQEYSQLALGRLMQSQPPQLAKNTEAKKAAELPALAPLSNGHSATPVVQSPEPVVAASKVKPTGTVIASKKVEPKVHHPQPEKAQPQPAPVQVKEKADPPVAPAASVEKPAPAAPKMAVIGTAAFEQAPSATPGWPSRQTSVPPPGLVHAIPVGLERRVEIANAAVHPVEQKLELRDSARAIPQIDLNLGIAVPESLGALDQALNIPTVSSIAPPDAALWTAAQRDFTGSIVWLGDFASLQLSTTGFEESPLADARDSAASIDDALPQPEPQAIETAPLAAAEPAHEVSMAIPDPVADPLPVAVQGISGGNSKPVQAFGAALFSSGIVQIPRPTGLPLRPVILLGPAEAPTEAVKNRKPNVRILPPAPIKPSAPPPPPAPVATAARRDLGLSELRLLSAPSPGTSPMPKIVAAVAGAAIIGIGIFFFVAKHTDAPLKRTAEATLPADQWIAISAPDAKRERKVSVLQTSMGLSNYRLEFDSSIQIKGFGWVYRAQDAKNFYVSKIELEKAGPNPSFVVAHYAVIDGIDQPRAQVPLHVGVPLGGRYRIRFEAREDRFITWVQDQKVDEWTDARLKVGGTGLYSDAVERSMLYGDFKVTPIKEK